MSAEGLYRALVSDGDVVFDSWLSESDGRVRVLIEAPREGLLRHSCGSSRVHERAVRTWLSAPLGLTPVEAVMDSPRVKCLACSAKTWHQPAFANGQPRITQTFEAFLERQISRLTIQDVVGCREPLPVISHAMSAETVPDTYVSDT